MPMQTNSRELLRIFLAETDELLDSLAFDCGRSARPSSELAGRVRRAVHTIKGNAAMLGLDELVRASHNAEERLTDQADILDALDAIGPQLDRLREQVGMSPEAPPQAALPAKQMVRVDHDRLVELEHLVSEVSAAAWLLHETIGDTPDPLLASASDTLSDRVLQLNQAVAHARRQPFSSLIGRASRLVHELSSSTGRPATIAATGEDVEIDRALLEALHPACVQLIRNSFAHGLEPIESRIANRKPGTARLTIDATIDGDDLIVSYADDGRGLAEDDEERILEPGYTTAESPGALAGRGVGMDVVRTQINGLGGRLEIDNRPGLGLTFRLILPLNTSI